MILAVALSPSVDVSYVVEEFAEGAQVRPLSVHRVAGGKAINAARAAAALGGSVRVVAALAGPSGELVHQLLTTAGIATDRVDADADTRTCVSVFSVAHETLTEIYEHAPSIRSGWSMLIDGLRRELSTSPPPDWMLVSGSIPDTGVADPIAELAELAREFEVRLAIDTHGVALKSTLSASPALIKVNRREASEVLELPDDTPAGRLAALLRERSGAVCVVTDGEAGSVAVDHSGTVTAQLPGVRGGYPVGSGDSYLGALLTGLDRGNTLAEALRLAAATATANALRPGAAVFDNDDIERLAPQVLISGS